MYIIHKKSSTFFTRLFLLCHQVENRLFLTRARAVGLLLTARALFYCVTNCVTNLCHHVETPVYQQS